MYKVNAWFKDKVYLNDDDYIDSIAQYDQTNSNKNFKMQTCKMVIYCISQMFV